MSFPDGTSGKELTCQCGLGVTDAGLNPELGRSPGGGRGKPLQYSCLENPTDRGAWRAAVHKVVQSLTRLKRFSTIKSDICIRTDLAMFPGGHGIKEGLEKGWD